MNSWLTDKRLWLLVACLVGTALLLNLLQPATAERSAPQATATPPAIFDEITADSAQQTPTPVPLDLDGFGKMLADIAPVMLLAALLGGLIAYRRRLTVFEHNLFHAHILLSVAGALMMLIVGNQLVRAFGLLGAASVVRYRYGLRNPRDAGTLIIALGIGMATGVGLYALAVSSAAIVFVFARGLDLVISRSNLFIVVTQPTRLQVRTTQPKKTMARVEQVFAKRNIRSRLRRYRRARIKERHDQPVFTLVYTVQIGPDDSRSALTSEISDKAVVAVRWGTEKPKKN